MVGRIGARNTASPIQKSSRVKTEPSVSLSSLRAWKRAHSAMWTAWAARPIRLSRLSPVPWRAWARRLFCHWLSSHSAEAARIR